jgi:hypothetical protein
VPYTLRARKGGCHFILRMVLLYQSNRFHSLGVMIARANENDSILDLTLNIVFSFLNG